MAVARYKPLVDALTADIRAGRLAAGARLPTHRQLAARENIAVVTATRVYAELEAAGLVSREQGRGTFVRDLALPAGHGIDQHAVAGDVIDLNFNYPALPEQGDLLRQALRDLAGADIDALLRYQPHAGRMVDRATVAQHLTLRDVFVPPEQVLIVDGAQHGLAVTLMATTKPGDVIAVDALTYPGFKVIASALHLEMVSVPITEHGPDLDALQRLCRTRPVRAIYTMPTLHNPLGHVMTTADRQRLADIARTHGALLIEDASYAYLVDDAPQPLATIAPDVTVYVSGLSKSLATGLRVGFIAAPDGLIPALERAVRATTWNTPALTVAIACRWIHDGTVGRLEQHKRDDATHRQALARGVFAGHPYICHPQSYFMWLPLPEDARADRIAATLAEQHISVSTAEPFTVTSPTPQALRLALGSASLATLTDTLTTVAREVQLDSSR
ncbi:PLP-dependent aminotransferase family protein [Arthrobacter sp. NEB 688]|uniref:aminotransferase-like domain-containing protein n=1 Tax=Arthrobacter sp. NEB 688 TaxID=904039 RepID=UPI001563100B|nr:PLP-dependent aminotransferase family protein [Arthrobacter sp. NEB 688]QKE85152.1 PLP-dependent aminotransferase family protein [Arthrobacter sp. NEB 688]